MLCALEMKRPYSNVLTVESITALMEALTYHVKVREAIYSGSAHNKMKSTEVQTLSAHA